MEMPMEWAMDLRDIGKVYGAGKKRIEALRGVSLQVRPGEIFGLLGPNGAGKSTLVKIMMTVVRPTRAAGTILGQSVGSKAALAQIGYLPEHHRFPRYLTGRQLLEFFGALAGVDRTTRRKRSAELLETVGMTAWADRRVDSYSKGMLQRVGLAQALINDPQLVVLDEPTDGVDPIGRRDILAVLLRLRDRGHTIFINSHLLSELEMISTRVAILLRGQVVRQGTIAELAGRRQWYEIDIAGKTAGATHGLFQLQPDTAADTFKGQLADGTAVGLEQRAEVATLRIASADPAGIQPTLDRLRQAGCVIARLEVVRPSLEDLFMEAVAAQAAAGHSQLEVHS